MVRRLVADMIRRTPVWQLACLSLGLAVTWGSLSAVGRGSLAMAISLDITYVLGPVLMLDRLRTPLVGYLPVSRRDVWRATWLFSTLGPATLIAVLEVPGTLATSAGSWSALTLSTVMDLLLAGAGCGLVAAADLKRGPARLSWIGAALLLAGMPLPLVVHTWLPTRWSDVRPVHEVLFAAGVGLTVWGWRHTPVLRQRRMVHPRASSSSRVVGPVKGERLSGLWRLLAHELAWSLRLGVVIGAVFLAMIFVVSAWFGRRPTTIHDFLAAQSLLVFDASALASGAREYDPTGQFAWYALYLAAVSIRLPTLLRHLRVLPLGTVRLHALLLAWPAVIWSAAWLLLAGLQWIVNGPHVTAGYQLPLLFACIGLSSLGIAIGLRLPSWWPQATSASVPLLIPFGRLIDVTPGWLIAVTALALGLAAALNSVSLSRGATYRRPDALSLRQPAL